MTDFKLRDVISAVCATSAATHPDVLAKEVLKRIEKVDERDALEQALIVVVRQFLSRDQRPLITPGGQTMTDTQTTRVTGGPKPKYRSSKVRSIRSAWQRQLSARVAVGHSTWKTFGDCTIADLDFLVQHRRDLAKANEAAAEQFATVRRLLVEHNVTTVREIPENAVSGLSDAA